MRTGQASKTRAHDDTICVGRGGHLEQLDRNSSEERPQCWSSSRACQWDCRLRLCRLRPVVSIQAAILNGFGDMVGLDAFQVIEVGQRCFGL